MPENQDSTEQPSMAAMVTAARIVAKARCDFDLCKKGGLCRGCAEKAVAEVLDAAELRIREARQ